MEWHLPKPFSYGNDFANGTLLPNLEKVFGSFLDCPVLGKKRVSAFRWQLTFDFRVERRKSS